MLKLCLFSSLLFIGFYIFETIFARDLSIAILLLPFGLAISIFYFFITVKAMMELFKKKRWKPILIQSLTAFLLLLIPINEIIYYLDFKINRTQREEVLKLVETGTIKSNKNNLIQLPKEYTSLSGGGKILVEKKAANYSVLFYTFAGVLDNFSGIVYSPNNRKPLPTDFGGDGFRVKKFDENWYYVVSN